MAQTNQRSRNWHLQVVVDTGHMETCLFADPWRLSEDKQTMRKLVNTGGNLTQGISRGSLKRMTSRLSRRVQQNSLHEWRPQDIQDTL